MALHHPKAASPLSTPIVTPALPTPLKQPHKQESHRKAAQMRLPGDAKRGAGEHGRQGNGGVEDEPDEGEEARGGIGEDFGDAGKAPAEDDRLARFRIAPDDDRLKHEADGGAGEPGYAA